MNFAAVIYDMDGLLIDSEKYWLESDTEFYRARSVPYTPELKAKMTGSSMLEGTTYLKETYGLQESVEELIAIRTAQTEQIYDMTVPMAGATTLIELVAKTGVPQAIASGSFLSRIEKIVDRFGWRRYMKALVSSDHVNYVGKPNPDIFLYTAKQLGMDPSQCVVLEDGMNGIIAAKEAGMQCIGVVNQWSFGDHSRADLVVETLEDPKIKTFIGI